MRKLVKYLRGYIKECIIGPLFKMLEACFELSVPIIMARVIDIGIAGDSGGYIIKMGGLLVLMGVLGLSCSLIAQYFAAKAAYGFGTAVRSSVFKKVNSLSFAQLESFGTSSLITRITGDINRAQSGVNLVLRLFLRSPFIVIGAFIAAFSIDARTAVIFAVAIPVIAVIIYAITALSVPMYKAVQKGLDRISLLTRENLSGVRVIRAFARQADEKAEFEAANDKLKLDNMRVGRISALMNPLTYTVVNLAIIAVIWRGGLRVYSGDMTQGEVVAMVNYMTQILLALIALAQLIVAFTQAIASGARISEVLDLEPDMSEGMQCAAERKGAAELEFSDVSFAYKDSSENALSHISFRLKPGMRLGIIGGTGSGKSTLVKLILRFYDVTEGSIKIDGADVRDYTFDDLRSEIGYVPQKASLFMGTVRSNMQLRDKNISDEGIIRALKTAQAYDFVSERADGLESEVAEGGKNFSGGQRQRLTIARALAGSPRLLILDDSSSALDLATDAALRRALAQRTSDMTVVTVSQRISAIRDADIILVLDDGEAAGIGTHEELLHSCEVYREICEAQLSEEVSSSGR